VVPVCINWVSFRWGVEKSATKIT